MLVLSSKTEKRPISFSTVQGNRASATQVKPDGRLDLDERCYSDFKMAYYFS